MKALILVAGNEHMKNETIARFKELRQAYRQVKILLSENARDIYMQDASRPFAGFEYIFGDEGIGNLQGFDHFHILNPTVNTLSKMSLLQADNPVALVAKRALLWGKQVYLSLDQLPAYPEGMMDEFNLMIEKLTKYGYIWNSDAVPTAAPKSYTVAANIAKVPVINSDQELARYIDHTLLKADASQSEIEKLCAEAMQYNFFSVCVNPDWISTAANILRGSNTKVCTVIGFPLGATTPAVKAFETRNAIENGADEIDMVLNIGKMKSKDYNYVRDDIKAVVDAANGTLVKVILETALLTREEIIIASRLSKEAGADFVKTSTGFSTAGATIEHIKLMRTVVGPEMGVKASGGVRGTDFAKELIAAGATRLGASASIAIVTGQDAGKGKY
jgi:deoxyribose-phosphate aldolase